MAKYEIKNEPMVVSKKVMELFLMEKERVGDLIGLYLFYYYTAKWQGTSVVRATVGYVGKGMKWSKEKVRVVRKRLLEMGLIEDKRDVGEDGKVKGWYVKVKLMFGEEGDASHTTDFPYCGFSHSVDKSHPNALLNTSTRNALTRTSKGNAYGESFLEFWKQYPKKVGKGAAWKAWKKEKPDLDKVENALAWQKETAQWKDEGGKYIPNPATYVNQRRWEDEPRDLKPSTKEDYDVIFRG